MDLLVSKARAAREKDIEFNRALPRGGGVGVDEAVLRGETLPDRDLAVRVVRWIRGLR